MNIVDVLNQIWTQILEITSIFVMPDWTFVISLLPIIVLFGLVMPFLTGLVLGTGGLPGDASRGSRSPSRRGRGSPSSTPAASRSIPSGCPTAGATRWSIPSGTTRCERCQDPLAVICPMCSLGRSAAIDTCTNCGLVLKVVPRAVAVRTTPGPKPGGAAVA